MRLCGGYKRSLKDILYSSSKIKKLKEFKAPRDDGIAPKFSKNVVYEIAEPLTELFNKLIIEGTVAQD